MSTLDQEIENLNNLNTWSSVKTFSLTLRNCTGTINGSLSFRMRNDNKALYLYGSRLYISSFSRTAANPGFNFSNTDVPSSGSFLVGFRGESANESVSINFSSKTITTNETFSSSSGTRLTLMIMPAILYFN